MGVLLSTHARVPITFSDEDYAITNDTYQPPGLSEARSKFKDF
jgi:hypothetical protein